MYPINPCQAQMRRNIFWIGRGHSISPPSALHNPTAQVGVSGAAVRGRPASASLRDIMVGVRNNIEEDRGGGGDLSIGTRHPRVAMTMPFGPLSCVVRVTACTDCLLFPPTS